MPMNRHLDQLQPSTQIGGKSTDLCMVGLSVHEHGPSVPATVGLVFQTELPKSASGLPYSAQTLTTPFEPSKHNTGQSEYISRRSAYMVGQFAHTVGWSSYLIGHSGAEYVEHNDNHTSLHPHPSQTHCYTPTVPQDHDMTPQTPGVSTFWPAI